MDSPCIKQTVCKVFKIFQCGKYLVAYVHKWVLRWYQTHQHISKKLPSFDTFKNRSKLIYFDKNNRTLPCFLKSYLTLKIVKYEFFKISISLILKKLNVRNAIFFLGIRYMLLANKRTQKKNSEKKNARSLFFKLKSIL